MDKIKLPSIYVDDLTLAWIGAYFKAYSTKYDETGVKQQ